MPTKKANPKKLTSKPAESKKPATKPVDKSASVKETDNDLRIPITMNEVHHHNNIQLMDVLIIALFTVNIVLVGVKIGRLRY